MTAGHVRMLSVAPKFSHSDQGRCTESISLRPACICMYTVYVAAAAAAVSEAAAVLVSTQTAVGIWQHNQCAAAAAVQ
eukprot:13595-Heterococcus_DN1.PRE.5